MAYTLRNFKTKKELKEALARGERVSVYNPGPFPLKPGTCTLEGPHYPEMHRWYAECRIDKDLCIIPGSLT